MLFRSAAIILAFLEDGVPAQTRLRAFEDEKLEKFRIIMDRNAPLGIVIGGFQGIAFRPRAALLFHRVTAATSASRACKEKPGSPVQA